MESTYLTLALLSLFSLIGGIVASKTRLPPALGLLLVGAVMGPSGLGYLSSGGVTEWLIDIGAVVLLFITGLEFDAQKLQHLGAKAIAGAMFKIGIVFFLTYHSVLFFGFSVETAVFLAIILSFSSTIVIVKVLEQQQMLGRKEIPVLLGILIAEDLFAILALSFIVSVKSAGGVSFYGIVEKLIFSMLLLLGIYLVCLIFLPKGVKWLLRNTSEETMIFIDLVICLSFAIIAELLGLSSAIGAFLAGSIVASLPHAKALGQAVAPFSMIVSSLFFLSMGTLVDLSSVLSNWKLLALLTGIIIFSRVIAVTLVTNVFANFKEEQAIFSSFAMFSVGEFSLLIARHAGGFKVDVDLISMSAIVIFFSSIMMAFSVKRTKEGALLMKTFLPHSIKHAHGKLQMLSDYLNRAFQEFSVESSYSNAIKSNSAQIFLYSLLMFLLAYAYQRLHIGPQTTIAVRAVFAILLAILVLSALKALWKVFTCAAKVLRPIHSSQDPRVGARIISNFILLGVCFLIGLYLPFFIFLLKLGEAADVTSVALVVIGCLLVWRTSRLIQVATRGPPMRVRL